MRNLIVMVLVFGLILSGILYAASIILSPVDEKLEEVQSFHLVHIDSLILSMDSMRNYIDTMYDEDEFDPHTFDSSGNLLRRESNE